MIMFVVSRYSEKWGLVWLVKPQWRLIYHTNIHTFLRRQDLTPWSRKLKDMNFTWEKKNEKDLDICECTGEEDRIFINGVL